MENQFRALCKVVEEQHLMLAQMAKLLESSIAIREAHTSILQTLTTLVSDNPAFQTLLCEIHTKRLNLHVSRDVDNSFIQTYIDNINAFLADEQRYASLIGAGFKK